MFRRAPWKRSRCAGAKTHDGRRGRRSAIRVVKFEVLEVRDLLAATYSPTYMLSPVDELSPYGSASPVGYTPQQIRHAYRVDAITFLGGGIQGDGTGQTIAIIDAYDTPTAEHDLQAFSDFFGLPTPNFTRVAQDGSTNYPPTDPAGPGTNNWEGETALDIEWAHAMAPGANILLVEANDPTTTNLFAAVDYARNQPGVAVISMSFGGGEAPNELMGDSIFTTPSGHSGVTFLASTGDSGAPGGYPAYSPNVVAVGGTTLTLDASNNIASETGWSGGGGGISQYESQPSYQNGVVTQSTTQRTTPDVALVADPSTGVAVYDSYNNDPATPWYQVGGTSLSAPAWAGLIAIIDQGRVAGGLDPLDGRNETLPKLYSISANDFNDITQGNNGFAAGPGYDLVTGRGSPKADLIAGDLGAPPLPVVSVVNNVSQFEGNSGTSNFVFQISISGVLIKPVVVGYTTVDGTANAPSDYAATSGTLTFGIGGPTTLSITVVVNGDTQVEQNETFKVVLSNPDATAILAGDGTGTILNDDVDISINDVAVYEGQSGTKNAVFTISSFGAVNRDITFSYTTLDDTALAGSDYQPRAGAGLLSPQSPTAYVTVPIIGDRLNEGDETFDVVFIGVQGARIAKEAGVGTILDDDPLPNFYVNDAYVTTTLAGQTSAVFTVGLDAPSGREVDVNYGTADGSAADGTDYAGKTGDLVFAPGVTTLQVSVPVYTNAVYSSNKKFYLDLSGPTNANLYDPDGAATIIYAPAPIGQQIIDDGAAGFAATGPWTNLTNTLAYQLDYDYASAGTGSATATWSFTAIPNGSYEVFARWIPFSNRATNAPFTILNNQTPLATVLVNEQQTPTGDLSNGVTWQSLGTFTTTSNTLRVRLSNNANGYVVADAIRIVANGIPAAVPEIDVSDYDHSINPGDMTPAVEDGTDFGSVPSLGVVVSRTYTITNTGNAPLHLTGSPAVSVGGPNASDFTVVTQPASVVAPGGHTTFQVNFRATGSGIRTGVISIASDDSDEPGYTFFVRGTLDSPAVVPLAHNAGLPQDVNGDNRVTPNDMLVIINQMLEDSVAQPQAADAGGADSLPKYFVDVNADGRLTPRDLLMVINYLLAAPAAAPSAAPAAAPLAAPAVDQALALFVTGEEDVPLESLADAPALAVVSAARLELIRPKDEVSVGARAADGPLFVPDEESPELTPSDDAADAASEVPIALLDR